MDKVRLIYKDGDRVRCLDAVILEQNSDGFLVAQSGKLKVSIPLGQVIRIEQWEE